MEKRLDNDLPLSSVLSGLHDDVSDLFLDQHRKGRGRSRLLTGSAAMKELKRGATLKLCSKGFLLVHEGGKE